MIKEKIMLNLPIKMFSLLTHVENIEYVLKEIESYSIDKPVVGYYLRKCLSVRQKYHQLMPQEVAESIKKEDRTFNYITLDKLLERKKEIAEGKYKTQNGLVIGFKK